MKSRLQSSARNHYLFQGGNNIIFIFQTDAETEESFVINCRIMGEFVTCSLWNLQQDESRNAVRRPQGAGKLAQTADRRSQTAQLSFCFTDFF
jgi:hypothetical protein